MSFTSRSHLVASSYKHNHTASHCVNTIHVSVENRWTLITALFSNFKKQQHLLKLVPGESFQTFQNWTLPWVYNRSKGRKVFIYFKRCGLESLIKFWWHFVCRHKNQNIYNSSVHSQIWTKLLITIDSEKSRVETHVATHWPSHKCITLYLSEYKSHSTPAVQNCSDQEPKIWFTVHKL